MNAHRLWKVKREFLRLIEQLVNVPNSIFDRFLSTPFHDRFERRQVQRFDGIRACGDRVAIYLVFPRDGLLASHKRTIQHLNGNGYAPLVVSNLPLSAEDIEWLRQNTYKFISRPNRGYDFGGYREGFLTLGAVAKRLEYLAFFNDSVWFPVPGTDDWLRAAEALGTDLAAAAWNGAVPRVACHEFRRINWQIDTTRRNFHYASYALLITGKVLADPQFARFWKRMVMSESKNRVVRRGEIALTRFILSNGYSHSATHDTSDLPATLAALSDTELRRQLDNVVTLGDRDAQKVYRALCASLGTTLGAADRSDIINLILTLVARIGVSYVLPDLMHSDHAFPFLKKSPLVSDAHDAAIMQRIGSSLAGPDGRIIENEMQTICQASGFRSASPLADTKA